jgi:hypothetical protein
VPVKGKLLVIPLIVVLLVVYAYFGMGYLKQRDEQEGLASQITEVTQLLREVPQPAQDLEQRLEAARAGLAAEQSLLPGKMNSTEIVDAILRLADECGVKAIPLTTERWSTENIGEYNYSVFRLDVVIQGFFAELVDFLGQLENGELETLIVEDLSVVRVDEDSGEEPVSGEITPVTASLALAVYTQSAACE